MSKIDLSKAKIGDKFRLKNGVIATYKCYSSLTDVHILENGLKLYVAKCDGTERNGSDVIEQVLYMSFNELIENELQHRQEVVELAEKLLIRNLKDLAEYSYDAAFKDAETFVKLKHKYLKDGKLC